MSDCDPICEETLKALERYLDGELTQEIHIEIESHLTGCNPCMRHADFRRHVKFMVSTKCVEHEVPPDLAGRILRLLGSPGAADRPS
jgi:mycothiol system anti-sigma-R factor